MAESKGRRMTYTDRIQWQRHHNALVERELLKQARNPNTFLVIHGGKSLNKQLPPHLDRPTDDYDTWARHPRARMDKMEDILDEKVGMDMFYEKETVITGTNKKVYRVFSRLTGDAVVDYMEAPNKKGYYKIISGVRWETLEHAKKVYEKILKNPEWKFRWKKARTDLNRILQFERELKKTSKTPSKTTTNLHLPYDRYHSSHRGFYSGLGQRNQGIRNVITGRY